MINPVTHLIFIVIAWLVFAIAGQRFATLILSLFGLAFTAAYAPVALAWIALTSIEACLLVHWLENKDRGSNTRQYLPYILLANLLFVDLHPQVLLVSVETLAISFSTIRIFMTAKQLLAMRSGYNVSELKWIFAAAFFLPALIVGPVFSGMDLRKQVKAGAKPDVSAQTVRFLIAGLVCVLLVNPYLALLARVATSPRNEMNLGWEGSPLLFAMLFAGFYGQSLVAEYTSRLFGLTLPYNFDRPWRAGNIREFWQRWHRSMANFVMQYIFLPLQMRGANAQIATIAAFVFMGLWHNLSAGYLIWGVAHGCLLAFWPKTVKSPFARLMERVLTWVAVIGLSYLANYSFLA
ncbi:MBOAT family O-acyltransferase [Aurantiacibacter odishensis]|uniref:MBOAT family O-acyltransferase n=1 Tax=Aurantiacibacter odishensis TaxID=1155476 RepID=UPI000E7451D6|nr:MBOAT family O-acyltransferase [Aurantiacibacter odishensis]